MSEPEPTVFVVDDETSVRKALARLFKSVELRVETFDSAEEFLARGTPDAAGCLVLDVRMSGLSGLELQERLESIGRGMPIVFITGHGNVPMSVKAMNGGAIDFIEKPFDDQVLLDAVHRAIERDRSTRLERADIAEIQKRVESLTPREREVFAQVVSGKPNKQIAFALGISEKTVKVHRARVMEKMGAQSLAALVRLAERVGIDFPKV
jgi:RNA polymerase sigma factor (sigma-70 family)